MLTHPTLYMGKLPCGHHAKTVYKPKEKISPLLQKKLKDIGHKLSDYYLTCESECVYEAFSKNPIRDIYESDICHDCEELPLHEETNQIINSSWPSFIDS